LQSLEPSVSEGIFAAYKELTKTMKIMITSFGIEHSLSSDPDQQTMFYRMPPVSFRRIKETFLPDYELLLLCESVIMDEASFDRLVHGSVASYSQLGATD
jgi:hypothetical protein